VAVQYRIKEGAPPDSELSIRAVLPHVFKPNFRDYGGEPPVTSLIEAMNIDAVQMANGEIDPVEYFIEALDEEPEIQWDLVDRDGNVWSEKVADDD
jgi:hypothetical protein